MPTYSYSIFGLELESSIPLPELIPCTRPGPKDVRVRVGDLSAIGQPGIELQAIPGGLLIDVDGVARFAVRSGFEIVVDPAPGVSDRNVRLFLLGSALGAILHERGVLPLHANAVEIGGKAVAFVGASGAGKSTLAAWFHDRGHPILSDDVCAITIGAQNRAIVAPGLPRFRLCTDALEVTGRNAIEYQPSFVGDVRRVKFDVPTQNRSQRSLELAAIYFLERGPGASVPPVSPAEGCAALIEHTYRGGYVQLLGTAVAHWRLCTTLAANTPVFKAVRRWSLESLATESSELLLHCEEQVSGSSRA